MKDINARARHKPLYPSHYSNSQINDGTHAGTVNEYKLICKRRGFEGTVIFAQFRFGRK